MIKILRGRSFIVFFAIFLIVVSPTANDFGDWLGDLKGENAGHTVGYFLALPVSARDLSIGIASSCGSMDAADACFFPANLSLLDRRTFSITHLEWLVGLRKEYISGCFPVEDIGAIGFFSQIFSPGGFNNAFTIDENPSQPSLLDFSGGLSFGRSFLHKTFLTGVSVSYVESRLDGSVARTFLINTDASFKPSPLLLMHIRAGNIGPNMSYTAGLPEPLPLQVGYAIKINPLCYREDLCPIIDPALNIGINKIADEPLIAGVSACADLFQFLSLRAGYEYAYSAQPHGKGLSAGIGCWQKNYGADFGWKNLSKEFGNVWSLSVSVRLKEIIAKKAEDYFFIARQYYDKGRLRQSLNNAKKAVRLDPNLWKAHVLIATINAQKRRASGCEMAVLYTGNTNGQFRPVSMQESSIGGLARQSSVIRGLREQFPLALTLDAGNCLTQASHQSRAHLVDWFFEHCSYDAIGVGKGELDFGVARLFPKERTEKNDFICSNCTGLQGTDIIAKKTVSVGEYSFFICAVVAPGAPAQQEVREKLSPPAEELEAVLATSAAQKATLRVLIVNDSWEHCVAIAQRLPQADILLCGGIKQKFESPMKIGNALIISPGDGGKHVGKLILRFGADNKLVSYDNHLIVLSEDIPPDPAVEDKLHTTGESNENGAPVHMVAQSLPPGIFAFVSDRDTANGIYLKILEQQAEFPLTRGKKICSRPICSFACGKCAYFEEQGRGICPALRIMELNGADKRFIPFPGCILEAIFSPDGKWLYFSGRTDSTSEDIYRIKPNGAVALPVISWKKSTESAMAFSPDGETLIFASNADGKRQLFRTDSAGNKPICISESNTDNHMPRFDHSGKYLAFLSNKTSLGGSYDVWLYTMATGQLSQMTFRAKVKDFCWQSDAKTLVFSSGDPISSLFTTAIGSPFHSILIGNQGTAKDYSETHPRLLHTEKGDKILYVREMHSGERQIYWVNPDGSGDQKVVDSKGQDWME